MVLMYRNDTGRAPAAAFGGIVRFFVCAGLVVAAGSAFAQQDESAEAQDSSAIECDDGTKLQAVFDEKGVKITFTDGKSATLPMKQEDDKGFSFSNGKFTLSGNDETVNWAVGKKAAVACQFKDEAPEGAEAPEKAETPFDAPITIDTDPLPVDKANPDVQPQVNCYRFPGFMVKEVDLGEKGAASLAITQQNAACKRPAAKDEKEVKDETAGYFLGVKGKFVFFQAPDASNGGVPFVVYDTRTMKRLFEDSFEGEDFKSIETDGTNLTLTFRRSYTADCSLFLDGGECAAALKRTIGLGGVAKLPECGPAYEAEKKRTPEYAAEIEQLPSVLGYEVQLKFDGKKATVAPLAGETTCRVPD